MKSLRVAVLTGLLLLGACGTTRSLSYGGMGLSADAIVQSDGGPLTIMIHPKEDYLAGQLSASAAAGSGVATGLTWGLAKGRRLDPREVDRALSAFVSPVGCRVDPVRQIGNENVAFEGRYTCPAGVDLRALMAQQRTELRAGAPLRP